MWASGQWAAGKRLRGGGAEGQRGKVGKVDKACIVGSTGYRCMRHCSLPIGQGTGALGIKSAQVLLNVYIARLGTMK